MDSELAQTLFTASTWVIPVLLAITMHEAAHGFVARALGDDTAARLGRVTLNPIAHIDLFGSILLPAVLLLLRSPFLFGYAKPVPVNFGALHHPRRDMVFVALAGPGMNIAMALVAALLMRPLEGTSGPAAEWVAHNLENAVVINVVLAVFNMFPLPPLDGGRVVTGILPPSLSASYGKLEPYGMTILLALIFILPYLGSLLGRNLNVISWLISSIALPIIKALAWIAGET